MAITAVPADPDERARFERISAEVDAEFAAREDIRGYTETAMTDSTSVLDAILSVATSHDTVVQYYEEKVHRKFGILGDSPNADGHDSELNDYVYEVVKLCSMLAPAALRRIPEPVYAKAIAGSGAIESLNGEELEAFMRPIFEESGIGERFEVRTGYQVYLDAHPESRLAN